LEVIQYQLKNKSADEYVQGTSYSNYLIKFSLAPSDSWGSHGNISRGNRAITDSSSEWNAHANTKNKNSIEKLL